MNLNTLNRTKASSSLSLEPITDSACTAPSLCPSKGHPKARPAPNQGSSPRLQGKVFIRAEKVKNVFLNLYQIFSFRDETIP